MLGRALKRHLFLLLFDLFLDLFKTPMIRRNAIVMSFCWFALGTLYFGLSLNMPEFDANIYLIFFLSGLVEIPADIIPFVLLNK